MNGFPDSQRERFQMMAMEDNPAQVDDRKFCQALLGQQSVVVLPGQVLVPLLLLECANPVNAVNPFWLNTLCQCTLWQCFRMGGYFRIVFTLPQKTLEVSLCLSLIWSLLPCYAPFTCVSVYATA